MEIGQIKLYKRMTAGLGFLERKDAGNRQLFASFGNCQHVSYENIDSFSKVFEYSPSEEINGVRYAVYTIYFFNVAGIYDKEPFSNDFFKDNYFLVVALNLTKSSTLANKELYNDSDELYKMIKREVNQAVGGIESVNLQVYASLGSLDTIIIANSKNLEDLMDIWPRLRVITMPNSKSSGKDDCSKDCERYNECTGEKTKEYLFRTSNTFLVVSNEFNLDIAEDITPKPSAIVRYSLNDINYSPKIVETYKAIFDDSIGAYYYTKGEYDISFFLKECSFNRLLYLMGVRGVENENGGALKPTSNPDEHRSIDAYEIYYEQDNRRIESSQVRLVYGSKPDVKPYGTTNDGEMCCASPDRSEQIDKLNGLRTQVYNEIPLAAKRTLDYLVDKCNSMLRMNHRYIASRRLFEILVRAMGAISSREDGFIDNNAITTCLGNISASIDTILMADNMRIDQFASIGVETITPATKLLYAYESIVRKVFSAINKEGSDILFFFTINSMDGFKSKQYFSYIDKLSSLPQPQGICSVNIPDLGYFDIRRSMRYIAHELSHYVFTGVDIHEDRNKLLKELTFLHMNSLIWDSVIESGLTIDRKDCAEFVDEFFMTMDKYYSFNYSVRSRDFVNRLIRFMDFAHKEALLAKTEFLVNADESTRQFYYIFCTVLGSQASNFQALEFFRVVSAEARADIIMARLCDMGFDKYMDCHFTYLEENRESLTHNDAAYIMRLASVLSVIAGDEKQHEERRRYKLNLHKDKQNFLDNVLQFKSHNLYLTQLMSTYLTKVRDFVDAQINTKIEEDQLFAATLKLFRDPESMTSTDLIKYLHNEWYYGLCEWGREK